MSLRTLTGAPPPRGQHPVGVVGKVDHRRPRPAVIDRGGGNAKAARPERVGDRHRHAAGVATLPVAAVAAEGHPRFRLLPVARHAHVCRGHCPQATAKADAAAVEAGAPVIRVERVVHVPHPHHRPAYAVGGAADEGAQVVAISGHGRQRRGGEDNVHTAARLAEVEEAGARGGDRGGAAAGGG